MKQSCKIVAALAVSLILVILPGIGQVSLTTINTGLTPSTSGAEMTLIESSPMNGTAQGQLYRIYSSPNKYLLKLTGTGYQMGFQHGYLQADGVQFIASDATWKQILLAFAGVNYDESIAMLNQALNSSAVKTVLTWLLGANYIDQVFAAYSFILDVAVNFTKKVARYNYDNFVPAEFKQEMVGMADGVAAKKGLNSAQKAALLECIIMINLGFDSLLSFLYPLACPWMALGQYMEFHSCDGFIATDHATKYGGGGNTIMGRNWMFVSYGLKDYSLLIEYKSTASGAIKFVAISLPSFVAVTTGMNYQGIGIGVDMIPAFDCDPGHFGLGAGLLVRYALQYKSELNTAVDYLGGAHIGVPWLFLIGDGKGSNKGGAIVERSASWWYTRGMNYPWDGVITYCPNYEQVEYEDDLVTVANAYGHALIDDGAFAHTLTDSCDRYLKVTKLALSYKPTVSGDTFTLTEARNVVDYAHPVAGTPAYVGGVYSASTSDGHCNWACGFHGGGFKCSYYGQTGKCYHSYGLFPPTCTSDYSSHAAAQNFGAYYGTNTAQPIQGIRTAMDLTNVQLNTLYGYYGHPWISYTLTA